MLLLNCGATVDFFVEVGWTSVQTNGFWRRLGHAEDSWTTSMTGNCDFLGHMARTDDLTNDLLFVTPPDKRGCGSTKNKNVKQSEGHSGHYDI